MMDESDMDMQENAKRAFGGMMKTFWPLLLINLVIVVGATAGAIWLIFAIIKAVKA